MYNIEIEKQLEILKRKKNTENMKNIKHQHLRKNHLKLNKKMKLLILVKVKQNIELLILAKLNRT